MKTISNKLFQSVLWYTLIINSLVILIDMYNFYESILTDGYSVIFLLLSSLIFESLLLLAIIKLLRNQYTKLLFRFVLFYWVAQIIFFGIKGNTYAFTTGPEIAFFFKYVGVIESSYFLRIFTSEFSIHINGDSNRVYLGINLIPILVSTALVYISKNRSLPAALENEK